MRLAFVLDRFSPRTAGQVRACGRYDVELAYAPFYVSWLHRIEAPFRALLPLSASSAAGTGARTAARLRFRPCRSGISRSALRLR